MGLQSIDVQVVAINDPKIALDDMVKVWKSTNISIAKKDHQTLIFEKMYYKKDPSMKEGEKIKINVMLEQMEVTVFREQHQVPWEQVNVDFVVEYNTLSNNDEVQISVKNESLNNCLRQLPKEIYSFGLNVDETFIRPFDTDDAKKSRRASSFSILTRSTAAAKAVCTVLPEWDEQPTSFLVHATAAIDRSVDVDTSSVDLKLKFEKAEFCIGTNSIARRFCGDDAEKVKGRVIRIFSWCVDIVRCVVVGGCRLELI